MIERGFQVEVTGEGAAELARDESHLIIRSALTGLADLGVEAPGLRLSCRNTIPHGRGLGSSSAATVAGLTRRPRGWRVGRVDRAWLLRHANAIEGHPDNVAAAIYGGFVIAYEGHQGVTVAQAGCTPRSRRPCTSRTSPWEQMRRGVCCLTRCRSGCGRGCGRAALLVHAMAEDPTKLFEGNQDWLHQQYRSCCDAEVVRARDRAARREAGPLSSAGPVRAWPCSVPADLDELDGRGGLRGFSLRQVGVGSGGQRASLNALPGRRICGSSLQPGSDPGELPQQIWTGRRLEARRDRGGTGNVLESFLKDFAPRTLTSVG